MGWTKPLQQVLDIKPLGHTLVLKLLPVYGFYERSGIHILVAQREYITKDLLLKLF